MKGLYFLYKLIPSEIETHLWMQEAKAEEVLGQYIVYTELKKPSHHVRTALLAFQALSAARGAGRRLVCALVSCVGKVLGR